MPRAMVPTTSGPSLRRAGCRRRSTVRLVFLSQMVFWFTTGASAAAPATTTTTPDQTGSTAAPDQMTASAPQCGDSSGTATVLLVYPTDVAHDPESEQSAAVRVAITLDLDAQPGGLLPGVPSLTSMTLEAPCRLRASLTANRADVDISPGGSLSGTVIVDGAIGWRWDVSAEAGAGLILRLAAEDGSSIVDRPISFDVITAQPSPVTSTAQAGVLPPPPTSLLDLLPSTPTTIDVPDQPVSSSPVTSTVSSSDTAAGESLTDECRRRTERPAPGTWRPPADASGTVGTTLTIRAVLSADESSAIPPDDAAGSSAAPVAIPSVTCRVEARLVGQARDAEFDTDWRAGTVRAALAAEWLWTVTPLRDGEIPLIVELRGIAEDGGHFDLALDHRFVLTVAAEVASAGPLTANRSVAASRESGTSDRLPGILVPTSAVVALGGVGLVLYRLRRGVAVGHGRTRTPVAADETNGPTRVFLSYSRRDGAAASRLARDLEENGWEVWKDTEDIAGGESWRRSIVAALQSAHAVVFVVSPNSMISSNVERELTIADEEGKRVFPVLVAATDLVSGFRYILAGVQITDITGIAYADGVARLVQAIETHRTELSAQPPD